MLSVGCNTYPEGQIRLFLMFLVVGKKRLLIVNLKLTIS